MAEEAFEQIRKELASWEPRPSDVEWLQRLERSLKVGGVWVAPIGVAFEKVADHHLRLKSVTTSVQKMLGVIDLIERTRKVGERAGIRVDVEEAADEVFLWEE